MNENCGSRTETKNKGEKTKIQKCDQRSNQHRQNRLFASNQKRLFEEIEGIVRNEGVTSDAEESKNFWGDLWDNEVKHNEDAEWLKRVKISTRNVPEQAEVIITRKTLKQQLSNAKMEVIWIRRSTWTLVTKFHNAT